MSKAILQTKISSYLDWSLGLSKPISENSDYDIINYKQKSNINSLGISEDDFNYFMKKWKEVNLS